jgi:hypothetical protein
MGSTARLLFRLMGDLGIVAGSFLSCLGSVWVVGFDSAAFVAWLIFSAEDSHAGFTKLFCFQKGYQPISVVEGSLGVAPGIIVYSLGVASGIIVYSLIGKVLGFFFGSV